MNTNPKENSERLFIGNNSTSEGPDSSKENTPTRIKWLGALSTTISVTILIMLLSFTGWLQLSEWIVLDIFFQLRPHENPDKRIILVTIKETDTTELGQSPPFSDKILATLLNKIKQQKPNVIGLDLFRDVPVEPGNKELIKVFRNTPNLIGIKKVVQDTYRAKVAPPPVLEELDQVSSGDLITDGDAVVRRGIFYPILDDKTGEKRIPSLGLALALKYLKEKNIKAVRTKNSSLQLNRAIFKIFEDNDGGYFRADDGGYQILLNYRGPSGSFHKVSFSDVLKNRIPSNLMRDRIVLIGSEADSLVDLFSTPYSRNLSTTAVRTSGVEIHANLTSQIISAALDNRPLIQGLSEPKIEGLSEPIDRLIQPIESFIQPLEVAWVFSWAGIIAILSWMWCYPITPTNFSSKFFLKFVIAIFLTTIALIAISISLFLIGIWIPLVGPLLALGFSSSGSFGYIYVTTLRRTKTQLEVTLAENFLLYQQTLDYSHTLEAEVEERTREIKLRNKELEDTLDELKSAQEEILAQKMLASLGTLTLGVAHEIKNPLNFASFYTQLSTELVGELLNTIKAPNLNFEVLQAINKTLTEVLENLGKVQQQCIRINLIVDNMLMVAPHSDNLQPEPANIHNLINSAITYVHQTFTSKYSNFCTIIETEYDFSIEDVEVIAEEIERVFINVIDNACYAAHKKWEVEQEEFTPLVKITSKTIDELIEICVQDNGEGISSELLDKIFEPFFTTKSNEGTGLGLNLAYNIIVLTHGGEIGVETEPGVFTKFSIKLPQ